MAASTVRTIQNKLKPIVGYNISSDVILKHLYSIGIEAKSLNTELNPQDVLRGVTYITEVFKKENNAMVKPEKQPEQVAVEVVQPISETSTDLVISKEEKHDEIQVIAQNMGIEITETAIDEIAEKTTNVFTDRKDMLLILATELRKYIKYQLTQDENAFRGVRDGITDDVKSSNAAVINMVNELHKEVESGNQSLKRGINKLQSIFAVPES